MVWMRSGTTVGERAVHELSNAEFRTYCFLRVLDRGGARGCRPTNSDIAEATKTEARSVLRQVAALVSKGAVERHFDDKGRYFTFPWEGKRSEQS